MIKTLAEIVTALAAVLGVWIAWNGLSAWKKQLHGNTDHDIAWKYLEATLKVRNAINKVVRNPAIFPGEFQKASEEYYGKDKAEEELRKNPSAQTTAVYTIRWRELAKARQELDDAIVQAEIWWGKRVIGLEEPLNRCIGTLYVNLRNFLEPDHGLKFDHDTLYYTEGIDSEFDKGLNSAVKKMEDFARPFLREEKSNKSWRDIFHLTK